MSSFEDNQQSTGWRPIFNEIPATKNMAQKAIIPLGFFYSPFVGEFNQHKCSPQICTKCQASLNPFCNRDRQTRKWICNFCSSQNMLINSDIGQTPVEEYIEGKQGETGIFFIIDLCVSSEEMDSIKETLIKTIRKLPQNIFVGLVTFNRNIMLCDFSDKQSHSFVCFNGSSDYSDKNFTKLKEGLQLDSKIDPRQPTKIILNRFYVPISQNEFILMGAIESLSVDSHKNPRELRQVRATGCAMQISIGLAALSGVHTRFISLIGGPCTVGPGKVVDLPLKKTIRVYMDIFEGTDNAQYVKSATKYYDGLEKILVANTFTMDIWAFGLDQFGLLEMKEMVNKTGGILAMQEQFNYYIFQASFQNFYEADERGMFKFAIAASMKLRLTKEMRVNGMVGLGKSLKDDALKSAAAMEIGEGGTNIWYVGGIPENVCQCFLISHSDAYSADNKSQGMYIQCITRYKLSDNLQRVRVSTIYRAFIKDLQVRDLIRGFDQEAAVVMLARLATKKADIEDVDEVKKWLDRILLKFTVRFANYRNDNHSGFNLPFMMKKFPQYMYHLRRSGFINAFGSPPDQSIYRKTCLFRESLGNCITMVQPILLEYTTECTEPTPVELDLRALKEDVVLVLDTYFTVLVWMGDHIKGWKDQQLNQDPEYDYLTELFEAPIRDASEIIYDRLPVSNFYETFKNDGKERYLKSRVNPAMVEGYANDGNFVTDDAPIKVFMDFLVKSVINYSD